MSWALLLVNDAVDEVPPLPILTIDYTYIFICVVSMCINTHASTQADGGFVLH
jgi:hypothetical protein